jgi:hypothetical protein
MYYGGHIIPNCLDIHELDLLDGPLKYFRLYASLYTTQNEGGVGERVRCFCWNYLHVFNL